MRVAAGSEVGSVHVWDLRYARAEEHRFAGLHDYDSLIPLTIRPPSAKGAVVWELLFNPNQPEQLLTCSEDSTVCVLNWQSDDASSLVRRLENIYHGLSMNSVDVCQESDILLAAADSEAILFENLRPFHPGPFR